MHTFHGFLQPVPVYGSLYSPVASLINAGLPALVMAIAVRSRNRITHGTGIRQV
ncbi:hypothetical protein M501DRAFT_995861 [Patellaria atrata CBS 101060]|uniref:Uncharacterized protein n=1 Tax=Patellaria atrata CBS 101060 TaxID=1346257 RepID=A0A9P4VQ02_9PEZI|nr:hypothetical protein M501DRAFT_995861 [Patellaria atrata CBS 101060]